MPYPLDPLIRKIESVVASHHLPSGGYARWITPGTNPQKPRPTGLSEYGAADAINILYTIGSLPQSRDPLRDEMIDTLTSLRHPDGSFRETTHHPIHTTAHCLAALEILDAVPQSPEPCPFLAPYRTKEGLYALLEGLCWRTSPWNNSHKGAGVYAAMLLTGAADLQWQKWYFDWLWEHTDPNYGLGRAGFVGHLPGDGGNLIFPAGNLPTNAPVAWDTSLCLPEELPTAENAADSAPVCHHLYGWFHYMFNMEHAKIACRYPEQLIDTCLRLWNNRALTPRFCREVGFMEIDWVFAINRASRQTAHRRDEVVTALRAMAAEFFPYIESLDPEKDDDMNDLHMLFGAVCAIAELQRALPGEFASTKPMRLPLDRRPFI